MAERNKVLEKDYDVATKTSTIKFVASGNVITTRLDDLHPEIVIRAALHGINQKLGDTAAGKQGDEAEEAVNAVWEQIRAATDADGWNAKAEAGEARPSYIALAVFELKTEQGKLKEGETLEVITARYSGKDGAELRKSAMKHADVAKRVLQKQIEAKQAALAKMEGTAATESVDSL